MKKKTDTELLKMVKQLQDDVDKLGCENERLLMENCLQANRLKVMNHVATNYTIHFDENGKEVKYYDFKARWIKARGNKM